MHITSTRTKLSFGPYKGKTISFILENDPKYIERCILKLENFSVSETVLNHIKKDKKIKFMLSNKALQENEFKINGEDNLFENEYENELDIESKQDYSLDLFESRDEGQKDEEDEEYEN